MPRIALVWTQYAVHHVDRSLALARRMAGKAEVVAVEVATASNEYAGFPPSGETGAAIKRTLFPGRTFETIPRWRRFVAVLKAVSDCRMVCIGVPYSQLEFVFLAWLLRLMGKQLVLMCDSKFDDVPRKGWFEALKRFGLSCFDAVMVAGSRGAAYFRHLGFRRRPIVYGYDTLGTERIRAELALAMPEPEHLFAERPFIFIGRFIAKKNLSLLIEAFARYREAEPGSRRRLVLVGSGPLEQQLRDQAAASGMADEIEFAGFLSGPELVGRLSGALGLILVSHSEQWGLVINEAIAVGRPVIVSEAPGARDILVRDGINGHVVATSSVEALVRAMRLLGSDEANWHTMCAASQDRAWLGDAERFADGIELLLDPQAQPAGERSARYREVAEEIAVTAAQSPTAQKS